MAYIALPTRDSSFILLANAAPRLPRRSRVTASATCSLVDGAAGRPMRVQAASPFGANASSRLRARGRRMFASVEGSVTVEEPAVSAASEGAAEEKGGLEEGAAAGEGAGSSDAPAKREITVTTEQLVVGTVFTGKVRAIARFGAFVDIGAFTDGLVHISRLSSGYVKEVGDVVTVGQEVSVTVVEMNEKAGRIALSMRDKESEAQLVVGTDAPAKREITVTTEQLVVGTVFTGKVRAIESYGAFVDIGAFTDGLVHISMMSSEYVKEVGDVVTVGQEVSVTVVELNEKAGRIVLSMLDKESEAEQQASRGGGEVGAGSGTQGDGGGKPANRGKIAGRGGGSARTGSRANDERKATKLKKGQELKGTVKNIIRSGAFVEFAEEGEEGFLRGSEITEGGEAVAVDSLLTVGQEVTVRVLKIERGKAALTMKAQVDMTSINDALNTNVGGGGASNPFATFFRSANLIPATSRGASVDEGEEGASPAVEETAAVVESPAEEKPSEPEENSAPAVEETTAVVEAPAEEKPSEPEENSAPAVEETAAVVESPAEEKPSEPEETSAPAVEETAAVVEAPAEEKPSEPEENSAPAVEETAAVVEAPEEEKASEPEETPAPAMEETAAVLESPAEEKVSEPEEMSALAVEESPAFEESSSVEALRSEPSPAADESKEEPHSLSLGEIAEGIGGVVAEVEKVLETPAEEKTPEPEEIWAPSMLESPAKEQASEPKGTSAPAEAKAAAVLESPAEEKPFEPEETLAPAVEETAAVLEKPAEEQASEPKETSAPAAVEAATVPETVGAEKASEPEETSAHAVEETPALEESSSTEGVRSEPPPAGSLSLGEVALGFVGVVSEVEKVAEAAAEFLSAGDEGEAAEAERAGASPTPGVEEAEARAEPAETAGDSEVSREPEVVTQAAAEAPVTEKPKAEVAPVAAESKAASGPTAAQVKALREKSGAGMMECKKALVACDNDVSKASEYLRKKGLAGAEKKSSRIAAEGRVGSYVHDGRMGVLIEINCETDFVSRGSEFKELVADMGMQVVACPDVRYVSVDDVPAEFVQKEREIETGKEDLGRKPAQIREKIVEGRIAKRLSELALLEQAYIRDDKKPVRDVVKESTAKLGEKVQIRRFVRFNLGEGIQKKSVDFAAEVAAQTAAKADTKPAAEAPKVEEAKQEAEAPKVAVSAASVKELRQATGAGMMDCKKALAACENDVAKATDYLRKKGLASADKKSGRVASEGLVGSYIHDGRIGVLVEVNSETDFVARSAQFKELVGNIGMQVAACPQVQFVSVDEIPAEFVAKEKEIEMGKEDLAKRPEAVRGKIVEGRVAKTLNELALLEQPYIRDDKMLVKEYVKQTVAALGENIQVRRFARFNLGEGIEKRSTDFAAEVAAAQTGSKA